MAFRPYTAADRSRMAKMWADGLSASEIAEAMGRTTDGITSFMYYHRGWFPARRARVDVSEASRLREEGVPVTTIAARFGVTYQAVYTALARHRRQMEAA